MSDIPCRFSEGNPLHTDPAVFHVRLDRGCACYPNDREQWLCWQHFHKCGNIGSIEVIESLEVKADD